MRILIARYGAAGS